MSKNNWYKRKNDDLEDIDDPASPRKKMKDGGDSQVMEESCKDSSEGQGLLNNKLKYKTYKKIQMDIKKTNKKQNRIKKE